MKIAFVIPVLSDINLERTFNKINEVCGAEDTFDIYFAINGKLNEVFTKVRSTFLTESRVKAFMVDRPTNEHKLITLGMEMTADHDATVIYSGKEDINPDVLKAFLNSWKAGNKIVYLRKEYYGFKKIVTKIRRFFYNIGIKVLGIFKDRCAETDIQLLDQDVVKTINQLPQKNRQLRVLDSFVGYTTDIVQLEVDSKTKENKAYIETSKTQTVCKTLSLVCLVLGLITILLPILAIILKWEIPALLLLVMFLVGLFGLAISFVFAIKKTLNYRVGENTELIELNDLRSKLEKYNITTPGSTTKKSSK